ncbi:NADH dehydrogenase [ubiquinone] 1 subunit C2 [Sciurus carolinensis]|uniref:NADH dehydrogenase [ubiquinone] 1 subunit C2 n=1 Tax=Sciurus carolinensis TaxID=30640 RepID=A0AA41N6P7_SCICA|nr:NADH dehydrogenase [ubiquinone] 1 subunit C2 [Sciurus carolinensis]
MMNGRPGRVPLQFLPDEARRLPPPKMTDPRLLYFGFLGYCSGLLDNALRRRPVISADFGYERFLGPEIFFYPEFANPDLMESILDVVGEVIQNCPINVCHLPSFRHCSGIERLDSFQNFGRQLQKDF